MTGLPPRDVFAAWVRDMTGSHETWDQPPVFICLHPDGGQLRASITTVVQAPRKNPRQPPARLDPSTFGNLMSQLAEQGIASSPADPPCAFALAWETWPEDPGGEQVIAVIADIHGRVWEAASRRTTPDVITERFHPPGTPPRITLIRELIAVAGWCGIMAWGKPVPRPGPLGSRGAIPSGSSPPGKNNRQDTA